MALIRYRNRTPGFGLSLAPWRELNELHNRISRLFDETFGTGPLAEGISWVPAVDVLETADSIVVTCELPGMTAEDVEISLENNVLTIQGEKKEARTEEDRDRRYHLWERTYGAFQRSFTLPRTVDADKISAEFANGVLTVTLPKTAEAKGRRIQISAKK